MNCEGPPFKFPSISFSCFLPPTSSSSQIFPSSSPPVAWFFRVYLVLVQQHSTRKCGFRPYISSGQSQTLCQDSGTRATPVFLHHTRCYMGHQRTSVDALSD